MERRGEGGSWGQESHVSEGVKFGFVGHAYNQIERLRGGRDTWQEGDSEISGHPVSSW